MKSLKIAVPNKGRLSERAISLIERAGINLVAQKERVLYTPSKDGTYTVVFLRAQDIPSFVGQGVVDIGITGKDIILETKENVKIIKDLNFGYCKVVVAVKQDSEIKCIQDIPENTKVATSFVNITRDFFAKHNKNVEVIEISGATEVSPQLGLADVIVDITSTGSTLKVNKLRIIEEITESEAVIIINPKVLDIAEEEINMFCLAIESVMLAEKKKYLMANIPREKLDEVKGFMPGLTSPTVLSLLDFPDQVAIHVVIDAGKVYESIKKLKALDATGILVLSLDQMVL